MEEKFMMYVNGQKQIYAVSATKILVKSTKLDVAGVKNALQKTHADFLKDIDDLNDNLFMIDLQTTSKDSVLGLRNTLNNKEDIVYTSPVLLDEKGKVIGGVTNQIFVRLKSFADYTLLTESIKDYRIETVLVCSFDERTYELTLSKDSKKDTMQIANELHEITQFEYVEPNLIHFLELFTVDTYFNQQWGLKNIGQSGGTTGVDIKAEQAWGITTGSSNIRVAVLDIGVEKNHPDLVNRIVQGYDATGGNSGGAPTVDDSWSAHGTACAGIVGAEANNDIGIAGVAYNCRIIPIRVTVQGISANTAFIAEGFRLAWENGADVISISMAFLYNNTVEIAINKAVMLGRQNRGCVVVASTGNENTTVRYPASSPNVIAVGAINRYGYRWVVSNTSGSNYGNDLDVVAPGVDIWTTDREGTEGYTTEDYYSFTGTSAATPHVAGVAAGILSIKPILTQEAVKYIIERKANKNIPYTFSPSNRLGGTWFNEVGHGLLDAYSAYTEAARSPISNIQINYINASLHNGNPGASSPNIYLDYAGDGWVDVRASIQNNSYTYLWRGSLNGADASIHAPKGIGAYNARISIAAGSNQSGYLQVMCVVFNNSTLIGIGASATFIVS